VGRAGRRFPALIPTLNRAIGKAVGRSSRTDYSYRAYASRRDVRTWWTLTSTSAVQMSANPATRLSGSGSP
jgi:hypothetical protein